MKAQLVDSRITSIIVILHRGVGGRWVQGLGTPIRARGDPWDSRKSSKKCARGGGTWVPDARRWIFCYLAYTACTCVRVSMATPILHSDGRSGHQRLTTVDTSPCTVIHRFVWPVIPAPRPQVQLQHCSNQHQEPVDAGGTEWSSSTKFTERHNNQNALFSFKMFHTDKKYERTDGHGIYAKNSLSSFINIKFNYFYFALRPPPRLCPWTPLGDRPRDPPATKTQLRPWF